MEVIKLKFSNYNDLFKYINRQIAIGLQKTSYEVEKIIKKYIMEKLYNSYQPFQYGRTYDFINSLKVDKVKFDGNEHHVKIYYDTSRIIPNYTKGMFYNPHTDYKGNPTNELIPLWIEEGTKKDGKNFFPRTGLYSMKYTVNYLESTHKFKSNMIKYLKQQGIKIDKL